MNKPTEKMVCPECGNELVLKNGKYGEFYGCSSYPECRYLQKKDATKGVVTKEHKPLDTAYRQYTQSSKPSYNPSSQYVSYAKDLTIAMLNVHVKARELDGKIEPIAVEKLAETATEIIKRIVKEFE